MNDDELAYTSAVEIARRIGKRDLSPVDVVQAILARLEALNPRLNAVCTLTAERAWTPHAQRRRRSRAVGPMALCAGCR